MPYQSKPTFKNVPDKMFEIAQPAIGGLNLRDLEYEQNPNQSPNMLNMMYRNGSFSKRYGQEVYLTTPSGEIHTSVYFNNYIFIHSGTNIYRYNQENLSATVATSMPDSKGIFIVFAQKLYYLISSGFYVYDSDNDSFSTISTYIPDFIINAKPDGSSGGDVIDDLNVIGTQFSIIYNGDGTTSVYHVKEYNELDIIDWTVTPTIYVDDEITTAFTVNSTTQQVTFTTAPSEGDMNVKMVFTMKTTTFETQRNLILSCKFYDTFGGADNSRLFLAGSGNSKYYWSQAYDISYFPENNFATLGNTEEDITGFGRQYNVLIVFKPREIYSIYSYTETSSTTVIEENIGLESFRSQLVNARIGCDAPYSIQLINNLLTWFNTTEGICTLVSTNIQDERNVRTISRNIDRTNFFAVRGILDYNENPNNIVSVDFENKYMIVFPTNGICFMWDYEISPYKYSSSGETDPRQLDWFLFDHFYVKEFLKAEKDLLYVSTFSNTTQETVTQLFADGNFADGTSTYWETIDNMSHPHTAHYSVANNVATVYALYENSGLGVKHTITSAFPEHVIMAVAEIKNTTNSVVSFRRILGGGENDMVEFYPSDQFAKKYFVTDMSQGQYKYFWITSMGDNTSARQTFQVKNVMFFDLTEIFGPNGAEMAGVLFNALTNEYYSNTPTTVYLGTNYRNNLIRLNSTFEDLDFNGDGEGDSINSYYMTPFIQFNAVEYLKNVKNIYIQCRGDTKTLMNISYYTDDSGQPEQDPEPVTVYGNDVLWKNFHWDTFHWFMNIWGNTFRRKCNLKKIQMCAVLFENNEAGRDMSISHIGFQYQIVKNVR